VKQSNIAAWSVRNPFAVLAVYLGMVIAAIASILFVLPTRMMPYVESPLISIVTMTPGYSPQEVETYFSKPIEERMTDLKGVRFVRSISQDGLSIITLQFPYGANMQRALVDVQQLVAQAQADLPYDRANLKPSYVVPVDPLNTPVLQLAVSARGWDPVQLRQFLSNDVVDQLKTVDGVQQVTVFGGLQRQLQVVVNGSAAAAYGLSLTDIRDAIDRQNVSRSGGVVTNQRNELIIRGGQRVQTPQDVARYPIKSIGGRTIFVGDVATVADGAAEQRQVYRYNGKDAIELSVVENPDAGSQRVIAAVLGRLSQIQQTHPALQFVPAYDNSRFVSDLNRNMIEELIVAVLLAGLVLLVFLEDVSATFIIMTSIPTCLGLAVLLFAPMHLSINSSTLIGLLLAIGRLVDDSIVVIHSVHRQLRQGKSAVNAAVDGTMQVVLPIAAATGVMVLAVLPLLTSGGITQIMFQGLVWPIIFALLASLAVSLTLTPLLAANLFYVEGAPRSLRRSRFDNRVSELLAPARRGLDRLGAGYRRALQWSLQNPLPVLGGAAIATYVGISLFSFIGSEMMPLADTGQAYAFLETTPGTSFTATSAKAATFEHILLAQPEVQRISAEVGEQGAGAYITGTAMNSVNDASYLITFVQKEHRGRSIWQIMDAVYAQTMAAVPGIRRLALKEMGADVMASNAAPVELVVSGPDLRALHDIAGNVANVARRVPGLVQVSTSSSMQQPETEIDVNRTLASQIGLSPQQVDEQAYYATHGGYTAEFFNPSNVRHDTILVRYAGSERNSPAQLAYVQIVGNDGQTVPLISIAALRQAVGPTLIEHDQLRRSVSVLGYYRKGSRGEMALFNDALMASLATVTLPQGYAIAMRGDMTEMMQSFDRLLNAMKIALVFIFLLLVVQFRSIAQPVVMLLAIPLQLLGVFAGLLLAHQNFSTVSILGIVVANGMAVSNAILLLDLVIRNRASGMSRDEAILAAGPVRLEPILMTTIVSLIVLIPVAFFPKTGIDAYSPLATVVIGGVGLSTILTLFVVPVLYALFDEWGERLRAWRSLRGEANA
jgi:HAE1 family hydrophobic/amphiphilic exporter-1